MGKKRKSTIANFLIDESPDFIGLQEVKHSQLLFLLESMIDYDFIGVGRDDGKTKGEYSPIFYNKNKFIVLSQNTFWKILSTLCMPKKKSQLVGMPQWKGFVHMGCLKILNQKTNSSF